MTDNTNRTTSDEMNFKTKRITATQTTIATIDPFFA